MSAYIVEQDHIRYLVQAAIDSSPRGISIYHDGERFHVNHRENRTWACSILWAANVKSVATRYPDSETLPGPGDLPKQGNIPNALQFARVARNIDPVTVLKCLSTYEYQSDQYEGWDTSVAKKLCRALQQAMIRRLPGYDKAPHSFQRENDMTFRAV